MFVQSMKFVESHNGSKKDVSVYGQEGTSTTYKLAKMNLAKRILYRRECDIFNIQKQPEIFEWMIEHYDKLCNALSLANEISE